MYKNTQDMRDMEESFRELLDEEHPEQIYQDFIEKHTALVPR